MLKVLVVEDEEMIRKGIILTVDWAALDCIVVGEAANGEEGLAEAKRLEPNLIITDLKMPKMDGLEMLRKLREQGCMAHVIILTAYDSFSYVQSALRLGAVDYLLKPYHDGDLEAAVMHLQKRTDLNQTDSRLPDSSPGRSRYVSEAMEYINTHYNNPDISISVIAQYLNISEGYLSHTFKKETDNTILGYLTRIRIRRAVDLLKSGNWKVYEVADMVGYRDIAYFSTTFKKYCGVTPSEFQTGKSFTPPPRNSVRK